VPARWQYLRASSWRTCRIGTLCIIAIAYARVVAIRAGDCTEVKYFCTRDASSAVITVTRRGVELPRAHRDRASSSARTVWRRSRICMSMPLAYPRTAAARDRTTRASAHQASAGVIIAARCLLRVNNAAAVHLAAARIAARLASWRTHFARQARAPRTRSRAYITAQHAAGPRRLRSPLSRCHSINAASTHTFCR